MHTHDTYIDSSINWIANQTSDLFLMVNRKGQILFVNQSLLNILQTSLEDMINRPIADFIHKNDYVPMKERLSNVQSYNFTTFSSRLKRKDGSYCTMYWFAIDIHYSGHDQWIQLIGSSVKDKNLQIDWLKTFFERAEVEMVIVDKSGNILMVNHNFEKLYGWTFKDLIGKQLPINSKYNQDKLKVLLSNVRETETVNEQRMFIKKKDGISIPSELIVAPMFSEWGEMIAISIITKDISELMEYKMIVEMQNKMMESEERLLMDITQNISEVICLFDIQRKKLLYISPSIKKWGISVELIYNNPQKIHEQIFVKNFEELRTFFFSETTSPKAIEFEVFYREKKITKWILLEITPIAEENGAITRHISIFKDITELKEQSYQIQQLDQLGAIGQLAAGIAHEVRNPLTSVKGFVQLLAEETNGKYNQIIMSEIDRIESILSEFLTLAKPQKEIKFKKEQINNVLRDVISFMVPEALLNNIQINMMEKTLPYVNCEAKQIKQVMINLIKNAIEAMPSGGNIYIYTSTDSNGFISIQIKDEGVGISEDRLKRLREPFFSNKEKGTGLGVMICFKIIEDHHGSIQFSSKEGEGTLVEILLPPAE